MSAVGGTPRRMRVGAVLPSQHLGGSLRALRQFVEAADGAGYRHLSVNDHVLGMDPDEHSDATGQWPHPPGAMRAPYTYRDEFHEPLTTLAYIAALSGLELVTGVLVLPQRQTALVAKQAAQVDLLSEGRLRLAVGVGWNPTEYLALGQPFRERGRRIEEQVAVLRQLWDRELIDFKGHYHEIRHLGINPRPSRALPIWMGGGTAWWRGLDAVTPILRRIGRLADGWYLDPRSQPGDELRRAWDIVQQAAADSGRPPDAVGLEGRVSPRPDAPDEEFREAIGAWREFGATHISIDTSTGGAREMDQHIEVLERVAAAAPLGE